MPHSLEATGNVRSSLKTIERAVIKIRKSAHSANGLFSLAQASRLQKWEFERNTLRIDLTRGSWKRVSNDGHFQLAVLSLRVDDA